MLAQLYLEDRLQPKRVEELLSDISKYRRQPAWMDAYLDVLRARNQGTGAVEEKARALLRGVPDADPRRALVQKNLLAG